MCLKFVHDFAGENNTYPFFNRCGRYMPWGWLLTLEAPCLGVTWSPPSPLSYSCYCPSHPLQSMFISVWGNVSLLLSHHWDLNYKVTLKRVPVLVCCHYWGYDEIHHCRKIKWHGEVCYENFPTILVTIISLDNDNKTILHCLYLHHHQMNWL